MCPWGKVKHGAHSGSSPVAFRPGLRPVQDATACLTALISVRGFPLGMGFLE